MTAEGEYKPKPLKGLSKFESKLYCPFEFYINIGSTFFLIPTISHNDIEILVFDWLWLHIGLTGKLF